MNRINLKFFCLSGSRLLVECTAFCIIVALTQQGFAQDATLTGVWTYSRDAKEEAKRYEAIDRATNDMNRLVRGRVREMLREKTSPVSEIRLTDGEDRITMSGRNRRVTFATDGSSNRVQGESGTATVRAERKNGQLVVTSQATKGVQTTVYSVSEDGTSLILDVSISGGKLPQPIRYRATYQRAER